MSKDPKNYSEEDFHQLYNEETGKKAIWGGKITKLYITWLEAKKIALGLTESPANKKTPPKEITTQSLTITEKKPKKPKEPPKKISEKKPKSKPEPPLTPEEFRKNYPLKSRRIGKNLRGINVQAETNVGIVGQRRSWKNYSC